MAIPLCKRLRLSIEAEDLSNGQEMIHVTLTNDMTLDEVTIAYEVGNGTNNKRYHRREAMIISMRRAVGEAIKEGLMTDSRYESDGISQRMRRGN